jgi:hypothetical protein
MMVTWPGRGKRVMCTLNTKDGAGGRAKPKQTSIVSHVQVQLCATQSNKRLESHRKWARGVANVGII